MQILTIPNKNKEKTMSYNKYTKYKIMDMKHNKQLINDEMVVAKMPLDISEPKITIAMVMEKLTEFMVKQERFNEEQRQFNKKIQIDLMEVKEIVKYNVKIGILKTPN